MPGACTAFVALACVLGLQVAPPPPAPSKPAPPPPTFAQQLQTAMYTATSHRPECSVQMRNGDCAGAVQQLLDECAKLTAGPAVNLAIAKAVNRVEPLRAHALIDQCNVDLPNQPEVMVAWAIALHQRKKYEEALTAYTRCLASNPELCQLRAMAAACQLHLGRTREAVQNWRLYSEAPTGRDIGDVHSAVMFVPWDYPRRAGLVLQVTNEKDADVAMDLLAQDCQDQRDSRIDSCTDRYFLDDWDLVKRSIDLPAKDARMRLLECAHTCGSPYVDSSAVRGALQKAGLFIDSDRTLPTHPGLQLMILSVAVNTKAISEQSLRKYLAPKLLARARGTKNFDLWSAVYVATPSENNAVRAAVLREAWTATTREEFAAAYLRTKDSMARRGASGRGLACDDSELTAALVAFPSSGPVWRVAYEVAKRRGQLTTTLLTNALKAEFARDCRSYGDSCVGLDLPQGDYLDEYFTDLKRLLD